MIYGSEALAPRFFDEYGDQLYLVPKQVVKEGVDLLRVEHRYLFEGEGSSELYAREHFQQWKAFYLEVCALEEAVLLYEA